jgi:hypothetical protein
MMEPALAKSVRFAAGRMHVLLDDGREISIPLDRFPRLRKASPAQRRKWQITAFGTSIRWPDIDEDIGIAGILGVPEELIDEAAGFTIHHRRR